MTWFPLGVPCIWLLQLMTEPKLAVEAKPAFWTITAIIFMHPISWLSGHLPAMVMLAIQAAAVIFEFCHQYAP